MRPVFVAVTLGSAAPLASCASTRDWVIGQGVNTTLGQILGHGSDWQPLVSEYLGVPYAKPPVHNLRFAAPQAFTSTSTSTEQFVADSYSDACASINHVNANRTVSYESFGQTVTGQMYQYGESFSEDCLALNVWTRPQSGDKKKAVMVWIQGGGFQMGSTRWDAYVGAKMANDHDVVVVNFNYRLGIFGFPLADFLDDVNLGLLDQRLAIEWVRDNIELFGGDPSRITLFGHSSGAASLLDYSFAYKEDPIANALIMQSGYLDLNQPNITREEASRPWYAAASQLGCGSAEDGAATLQCMQEKRWQDVLEAAAADTSIALSPLPDGKTSFADRRARLESGDFIQKPLLIGNAADEDALYTFFGIDGSPMLILPCLSPQVAASRALAGIPVWHYVYAGEWPNQALDGVPGAWHGSEIGMIFGTAELMSRLPDTEEQARLSWAMGKAWTDFAKDPSGGLVGLSWPGFDISDEVPSNIRLGAINSSEIVFERIAERTDHCPPTDLLRA